MIEQQAAPLRGTSHGPIYYLQFEHLAASPELAHAVFTRQGGQSQAPFDGLNVSFKEDRAEAVAANRLSVLQALGLEDLPCATIWQIHSAEVALFERERWEDWRSDWPYRTLQAEGKTLVWTNKPRRKADAIVTAEREVVLAMSFADCVPLLFHDPRRAVIALAHAGWRGTARGIAITTIEAMQIHFGSRPQDILVGIGPAIGACCYEVSEQVRDIFYGRREFEELPTAARLRNQVAESAVFSVMETASGAGAETRAGKAPAMARRPGLFLDLWETNRRQLLQAGVAAEHIAVAGICTACHQEQFFSYRAAGGRTGRFPVIMALHSAQQSSTPAAEQSLRLVP